MGDRYFLRELEAPYDSFFRGCEFIIFCKINFGRFSSSSVGYSTLVDLDLFIPLATCRHNIWNKTLDMELKKGTSRVEK